MIRLAQILVFVVFAALWELAARTIADPFYISSPSRVAVVLFQDGRDPGFWHDLRVTFVEVLSGYAGGAIAGIATATVFGRWPLAARIFEPFLVALNGIPRIALAPLIVIWFGIDLTSKAVLAATLVYFLTFFNTLAGMQAADPSLIAVGRVMGASQWQVFRKIVLPASTAWIMTGLRTSLPFALIGVIVGEFIGAERGIGRLIIESEARAEASGMMVAVIVLMLVGVVLSSLIRRLQTYLLRWQQHGQAE
jgi:NitT/TauT family transport system permease protein